MTNQYPTAKFALPNGVVLGAILIVIVVIMYVTGMLYEGKQWPMYLFYLIFPLFIGYSIYTYRAKNGGFLTLGQAIKVGLAIAAISGLVYAIYNAIFAYIIEPDFADTMLDVARENMVKQNPNMTEDQIETGMAIAKKMSNPLLGGAFFILLSIFFGFIYSLFSGLIFKRENPYQE